ncbi:MAG: hypothetical protein AB1486_22675 [Planctomycetota bacterium]
MESPQPAEDRSDPGAPLTPADELLLQAIAARVRGLGLTTFAIFMLEAHRPFEFFAGQMLHFGAPFLGVFLPRPRVDRLAGLLSRRAAMERLIRMLETREKSPAEEQRPREEKG